MEFFFEKGTYGSEGPRQFMILISFRYENKRKVNLCLWKYWIAFGYKIETKKKKIFSYTSMNDCTSFWTWLYSDWPDVTNLGGPRCWRFCGITYDVNWSKK